MISLEANEKTLREKDMALQPVPLNTTPDETYFRKSRLWQGIPGIERTYGGRFWRCFFSGGNDEGPDNYVAVEISDDACDTWSEPIVVIDPPGNVRAFDPCLWRTPSNELFLFWAQSYGGFDGRAGCWYSVCRDPDEVPNVWTEPRRIADGVMLNKPTVLMNGEWALPITLWGHVKSSLNPNVPNCLAKMYVSSDQGKTFEYRGGVDMPNRWFDESMILEKNDGTLQMLTRRKDGIGEAFSHDGGRTWGKTTGVQTTDLTHLAAMILIIWRETTWQRFCRLMMGKHGALRFFWMNANSFLIQMRCKRRTIKSTSFMTGSEMSKRSCCWRGSRKRIFCAGNWSQMDRF